MYLFYSEIVFNYLTLKVITGLGVNKYSVDLITVIFTDGDCRNTIPNHNFVSGITLVPCNSMEMIAGRVFINNVSGIVLHVLFPF